MVVELRRSAPERVAIWAMGGLVALLPLLFLFVGVLTLGEDAPAGALFLLLALPFAGLTYFVLREAAARASTLVRIEGQGLRLVLPAQRGYAPLERVDELLGLSAIRSIETRVESFRGAGTIVTQRAYALVLNNGRRIVLGGDRRMMEPFFEGAANAIAQQTGKPITDLGVIDANAGFILLFGQSAPPWDSAPLPQAVGEKRVRDEQTALQIAYAVLAVCGLLVALVRLFGG
ncbi:hypothetical protein [Terricaulis sp.]|uniref:hypothetical protein n=1 Tax=Terricaulis sp. TaxID=2768686 RepID=UPI003784A673